MTHKIIVALHGKYFICMIYVYSNEYVHCSVKLKGLFSVHLTSNYKFNVTCEKIVLVWNITVSKILDFMQF